MVWYSHLFQNFPQFIVIHTVKALGIVNKAEIDVFLEISCFIDDPADVGNLNSGSSAGKPDWFQMEKGVVKAVYCHPAYLTSMQSTSGDMLSWKKHKPESRLPGEISITSHMQMTPPIWQKVKRN